VIDFISADALEASLDYEDAAQFLSRNESKHSYKETSEDRLIIILRQLHSAKAESIEAYEEQLRSPPDGRQLDSGMNRILGCRSVLDAIVELSAMGSHYRSSPILTLTWLKELIGNHGGVRDLY
jgi:hypothetical protein